MHVTPKQTLLMIDTNVWVNYYLKENATYKECAELLEQCVLKGCSLLVAPTTIKDVFYLIPRRLKRIDGLNNRPAQSFEPIAWACIHHMMKLATPSPISAAECTLAESLSTRFPDFEDNLLLASGETAGVDYIVTYDKALLNTFPEGFITPQRALELLG